MLRCRLPGGNTEGMGMEMIKKGAMTKIGYGGIGAGIIGVGRVLILKKMSRNANEGESGGECGGRRVRGHRDARSLLDKAIMEKMVPF